MGSNTEELQLEAFSNDNDIVIRALNLEKIKLSEIHYFEILEQGYQANSCQDKIYMESMELLQEGA